MKIYLLTIKSYINGETDYTEKVYLNIENAEKAFQSYVKEKKDFCKIERMNIIIDSDLKFLAKCDKCPNDYFINISITRKMTED